MEIIKSAPRMQTVARKLRAEGQKIGLVPTMEGLHEGHLSLVRRAREMSNVVVVSIFSSPPELAPVEALEGARQVRLSGQPRYLSSDIERLSPLGVDYVVAPPVKEIFAEGSCTEVVVRGLSERLYGATHPEHLIQMTTSLVILFNLIRPDFAFFSLKDAQQVAIVNRLVRDLHFDVEICICPIVREADGLAASSENALLSESEREAATGLYHALERAQVLVAAGEHDTASIVKSIRELIESQPLAKIDHISIVDRETLEPIAAIGERPALVTLAVFIGKTRLSDSIILNV